MKTLIIEDDIDLALAMSEYLELHHVECDFAYNGASGIGLATTQRYDCLVLDNMLPKVQGIDVCRQLRDHGVDTPILMLTACDTDSDQLAGFGAGVDDFVIKPCPMPLLLARLNALYRRGNPERESIWIADLRIYPKEHRAFRADTELKLTPTSWSILLFLARRSPSVVSRLEIEQHIWPQENVEDGTLNVHLHQLRKVVDKPFDHSLIRTHVGVGLSLSGEQSP